MTNYSRSVLLSNGQIRGETLRNGTWPGGKTHPQRLSFPSPEQDLPGLFAHRPQTPQRSFQRAAAGTHATRPPNRAHSGLHGETGVFRMGALSLPSDRFARFGTPAWPGVRTANFAAFGPWSGRSRRTQRACGTAMRMMRVAVPRRRGPAGPRDPMAASLHRGTPRFCSTVITECGEKHTSFLCTELLCQLCLRLPPLCCTL